MCPRKPRTKCVTTWNEKEISLSVYQIKYYNIVYLEIGGKKVSHLLFYGVLSKFILLAEQNGLWLLFLETGFLF